MKIVNFVRSQARLVIAIGVALAVGGLSTAVVMAAIPDASGVIHGCVNTHTNALKVVDSEAGQTCNASNETALNWNQKGPKGDKGDTGPQGPQGPAGPAGSGGGIGGFVDNLAGADFTGANLPYRNFAGANLTNLKIAESLYTGSNFTITNLAGSSFANTNLTGAFLAGRGGGPYSALVVAGTSFNGANFTNATLKGLFRGSGVDFRNAIFTSTTFDSLAVNESNFAGLDFTGVNFVGGISLNSDDLSTTHLSGHDWSTLSLSGSNLTNADFSNSTFTGISLNGINAANTNFSNDTFTNSFFTGANLSTANLAGVMWVNTTCPDDTNSDTNGGTCIGHLAP